MRLAATGVCHTDACTLSGADPDGVVPTVLGHEGADVVEEGDRKRYQEAKLDMAKQIAQQAIVDAAMLVASYSKGGLVLDEKIQKLQEALEGPDADVILTRIEDLQKSIAMVKAAKKVSERERRRESRVPVPRTTAHFGATSAERRLAGED